MNGQTEKRDEYGIVNVKVETDSTEKNELKQRKGETHK